MKLLKAWLRRHGLLTYEQYRCKECGYLVPLVGSRNYQANIAVNHWQELHEPEELKS